MNLNDYHRASAVLTCCVKLGTTMGVTSAHDMYADAMNTAIVVVSHQRTKIHQFQSKSIVSPMNVKRVHLNSVSANTPIARE